jgi:hypothetical protein
MNNNTVPTGIPALDFELWCEQVGIENPFGEEQEDNKDEKNNNIDKKKQLKRKDDIYE